MTTYFLTINSIILTLLHKELSPPLKKNDDISIEQFNDLIIEAIQDKKGKDLVKLDLRMVHDSPTDFFIVCHGDSDVQVKAIAKNIAKEIKDKTGELPSHMEGQTNGTWVLVDFFQYYCSYLS